MSGLTCAILMLSGLVYTLRAASPGKLRNLLLSVAWGVVGAVAVWALSRTPGLRFGGILSTDFMPVVLFGECCIFIAGCFAGTTSVLRKYPGVGLFYLLSMLAADVIAHFPGTSFATLALCMGIGVALAFFTLSVAWRAVASGSQAQVLYFLCIILLFLLVVYPGK
ncbi:MAG: hypothetical protein HDS72_10925 [Bacteroidales bacterium]|nr:hypothetical protein [Bacteroidales bacterium]